MGKKRSTAQYADQFGDVGGGQDKEFHAASGPNKGSGGGGSAGGRKNSSANVTFERHVPKFLQAYGHMLGGQQNEDEPQIQQQQQLHHKRADCGSDDDNDDDDNQEALRRAIEEDPTLVEIHPELQKVAKKSAAVKKKEEGNKAFAAQEFEKALECFNECTELDPDNEVYFSNKAAALTSLKRYQEAITASRKVIQLKPTWAKGYSRLGAAHFALEEYTDAREAYEKASRLEPDDRQITALVEKAHMFEARQEAEGRHKFKKARMEGTAAPKEAIIGGKQSGGGGGSSSGHKVAVKGPAVKNTTLLSFDNEETSE